VRKKLGDSILFAGLDADDLRLVEQGSQHLTADKGTFLFFQDDPADRFYVVLSGKVKIFKSSPDGKEQILLMAGPGDSFGEAALFAQKIYPAAALVVESGEMVYFMHDRFMTLIHDRPTIAINMIARLAMLLHHLTRLVERLLPAAWAARLLGLLRAFTGGLHVLRDRRQLAVVSLQSLLVWFAIIWSFYPIILAFDFGASAPLFTPFLLTPLLALGLTIPGAPGGVGPMQAMATLALNLSFAAVGAHPAPDFAEQVAAFS